MKNSLKTLLVGLAALMVAGCSVFSPVKTGPENTYLLNKTPTSFSQKHTRRLVILVLTPEAEAAYNTTSMAYSLRPFELAYYSQNYWAETPSQMLQPLIEQTLQKTHYFKTIVSPPYLGGYDYAVTTRILTFQQDYTQRPATFQLVVQAQITKAVSNRVKATKIIKVNVPMKQYSPYGGVWAANEATKEFLTQLLAFAEKECR